MQKYFWQSAALASALTLIAGCSQSISDYTQLTPALKLDRFFLGAGQAYGVMHDWRGQQSVRFVADLCGEWQQGSGDLYEVFYFSDGRVEQRHWQLTQNADGEVRGTAGDVVGEATGQLAGNSLYWQYVLRIPYDGDTLDVTVKDWLHLVDEKNLINRTTLHKFGFKVAELTLSIQQLDANADCSALKQQVAEIAAD
ncbi:Protein of unknown function [Arsukibacterium tuosuense]|uniref:Lipoprotein n=1 Tax=Arsukibacterium tuosuense TaxID=1323745 RepID=A0A285JAL3_9GAMM|nr:DUF3833 domain-containing protein [Arsukibacterium tuosuense]SNY57319.1 Protein of unknown function [Arsukibacterium tuosuense]